MTDTVFIEGFEVEAVIGVHAWERRMRQPLVFDVEIAYDNRPPAASDALADTVDYAEVCALLRRGAEGCDCELLETLLERLAAGILREFAHAQAVALRVRKPAAARALGSATLGIAIRRSRDESAA